MTKKLTLVLSIVIAAAFMLGACATTPTAAPVAPAATVAPKAPVEPAKAKIKICQVTDTGGIDDKSFNAMAWDGVEKAIAELGVEGKYIESQQATDYQPNLTACKDEGSDLIIGVGSLMWDDTQKAALDNPKQKYAAVDIETFSFVTMATIPNLLGNTTEINDSTFLAGYLSAGMSTTKKVGGYVGKSFPATLLFLDGYYMGIKEYNKVHGTNVEMIGYDPKKPAEVLLTNTFDDTDTGRAMAETLLDEGVDIILPVAGPVGEGTLAVMKERGTGLVIGVDKDMSKSLPAYADFILASAMKRIDYFVYNAIKAVVDGTFTGGSNYVLKMVDGGTYLQYGANWDSKVPAELKAELDALAVKIKTKEIITLSPEMIASMAPK